MDRTVTALSAGDDDLEAPAYARDKFYPPVLTPEQAEAIHILKPFLKAVTDANRLAILQELSRSNGLNVLEMADRLLLSQPLTSWHLHILKRARLVTTTTVGRQRIYRLNRGKLQEYKDMFGSILDL